MELPGMRLVDLSVPLEHLAASEPLPAKIHYVRHDGEGLAQMQQFFGVTSADLVYSNGEGWAVEQIEAITHTGTHVDAPYHYGAQSEGRPARTIDDVPLEWCFAPGVVLDMRHKADGEFITVDDLSQILDRTLADGGRPAAWLGRLFSAAWTRPRRRAVARRARRESDRH